MRVVHYTHAGGSGAGRYVANLTTSLVADGLEVDLICPSDFVSADQVRASGVHVLVSSPSLAGASGRLEKLVRACIQTLNGTRLAIRAGADRPLVHLNFVGLPLLALPIVAALRLRGTTVVLTVHDVEPHRPVFGGGLAALERFSLRVLYRLATHLIVHYASGRTHLRRSFGIPGRSVSVIPHGAEVLDIAAPPRRRTAGEVVRIAILGSIRRNKGTHLAIEAVQVLRHRGLPIELTIAGQPSASEAAYWRECLDLIGGDATGFRVIARFLSDAEMRAELDRSDAVLLPYAGFSAQSGVAIDALTRGRAVIATAQGGLADLLAASGCGILIREASVGAVAHAIADAVTVGPSGLAILGQAGASYARASLAWPAIAERHRQLYRTLTGEPE